MKEMLLMVALLLTGCITKSESIRHGHIMYSRGYSVAMDEMALERVNIELANSYLREQLRRKKAKD